MNGKLTHVYAYCHNGCEYYYVMETGISHSCAVHDHTIPDLESNVLALNMGSEPKGHVLISVQTDKQVVDDELDFDGLLCSLHTVCCNYIAYSDCSTVTYCRVCNLYYAYKWESQVDGMYIKAREALDRALGQAYVNIKRFAWGVPQPELYVFVPNRAFQSGICA